jgi:hypothetical protein
MQTKVETDVAERIAQALEKMVEKLTSIEEKLEGLTSEVQSHGQILAEVLTGLSDEDMEGCCESEECDSPECNAQFVEIDD